MRAVHEDELVGCLDHKHVSKMIPQQIGRGRWGLSSKRTGRDFFMNNTHFQVLINRPTYYISMATPLPSSSCLFGCHIL